MYPLNCATKTTMIFKGQGRPRKMDYLKLQHALYHIESLLSDLVIPHSSGLQKHPHGLSPARQDFLSGLWFPAHPCLAVI